MRIVVTRPQPGAARTASRLSSLGHEPICLPLSRTISLPALASTVAADAAAVAVTSASALRHAAPDLIERLAGLPCYAVGTRTAQAARRAGFRVVHAGPGDAAGLGRTITPSLAGQSLVYLCGRVRFEGFERDLAAVGVSVRALETYDTATLSWTSEAVASLLDRRPADALLLYSAMAAQAAGGVTQRPELAELFAGCRVLALSQRVAAAFGPGIAGVEIAGAPTEDAMVGLLGAAD